MYTKFWVKTAFHRFTPGGFGYMRLLRKNRDQSYIHERDKHQVRYKHHGTGGWQNSLSGTIHYRDYSDYNEYVVHQEQKFNEIIKINGGFSNRVITDYRLRFYRRFRWLKDYLTPSASIVCLGARQGTEVEVLRDCGYNNAVGIDLNPGPQNPFVKFDDFMQTKFETSSVDMIYTNAVDHAFNLESFLAENARILAPDGYALYDIARQGSGGAFEAVSWQTDEDLFLIILHYFKHIIKVETEDAWKWVLLKGKKI